MDETNLKMLAVPGGSEMPSVGLGLWKVDKSSTPQLVQSALEAGYLHIDSACDYGNEKEAGEGIRLFFIPVVAG